MVELVDNAKYFKNCVIFLVTRYQNISWRTTADCIGYTVL